MGFVDISVIQMINQGKKKKISRFIDHKNNHDRHIRSNEHVVLLNELQLKIVSFHVWVLSVKNV